MRKNRGILFINIILSFMIILTGICAFTSCTDSGEKIDKDVVCFTDALDRDVSVSKGAKRVAALIASFAEIWQLSGGELCAAPEDAWSDLGLELPEAVDIGGAHSPNIELLLSSSPDLVLASASTAADVDMCDVLESAGITVIYFDVDSFYDYLDMLKKCTLITGRDDLFEKNGTLIEESVEAVKERYSNSNIPEREKRVLLLRASSGLVKAKGSRGTVLGEMLSDMGCINIADNDKTILETLSTESIIAAEPYHIFVVTMGDDTEAAKNTIEKMMREDGAWSTLDAVKEGRLHFMDRRLFNMKPNDRFGTAYEVLYETLTD